MRKLLVACVVVFSFTGMGIAAAENVCTDYACAGNYGDGVYVDGADGNPDPLDGYIFVTSTGGCADDNGSPAGSTNPTCVP